VLATFKYREGAVGTLLYSWEVPTVFKGLRISRVFGREGSITFESNGIFIVVRGKKKKLIFPGLSDIAGYKGMFRDFFNALRTGQEAQFTLELAKQDLQLIEEINSSK
jgi:predicted dehydrogenase